MVYKMIDFILRFVPRNVFSAVLGTGKLENEGHVGIILDISLTKAQNKIKSKKLLLNAAEKNFYAIKDLFCFTTVPIN